MPYCSGLSYDPDDPPEEPEKDLEALRSLAFETVLETPRTRIASELMESKYQRLRKLPVSEATSISFTDSYLVPSPLPIIMMLTVLLPLG